MPIVSCEQDGKSGHRWGEHGACYTGEDSRAQAARQAAAAHANGYTGKGDTMGATADRIDLSLELARATGGRDASRGSLATLLSRSISLANMAAANLNPIMGALPSTPTPAPAPPPPSAAPMGVPPGAAPPDEDDEGDEDDQVLADLPEPPPPTRRFRFGRVPLMTDDLVLDRLRDLDAQAHDATDDAEVASLRREIKETIEWGLAGKRIIPRGMRHA